MLGGEVGKGSQKHGCEEPEDLSSGTSGSVRIEYRLVHAQAHRRAKGANFTLDRYFNKDLEESGICY